MSKLACDFGLMPYFGVLFVSRACRTGSQSAWLAVVRFLDAPAPCTDPIHPSFPSLSKAKVTQDTHLWQIAGSLLHTQFLLHQSVSWILGCSDMLEGGSRRETVVELLQHLFYVSGGILDSLVWQTRDSLHRSISYRIDLRKEVCAKADPVAKASAL